MMHNFSYVDVQYVLHFYIYGITLCCMLYDFFEVKFLYLHAFAALVWLCTNEPAWKEFYDLASRYQDILLIQMSKSYL